MPDGASFAAVHLVPIVLFPGLVLSSCAAGDDAESRVGSGLRLITPAPVHRVVVAPFRTRGQPLSEDPDGLLLAELVQILLAEDGQVGVYPADQAALLELQGRLSPDPTTEQAAAIRQLTGADTVVAAALEKQAGEVTVVLDLLSAREPSSGGATVSGPAREPLELARDLVTEIRRRLAAGDRETGSRSGETASSSPGRRAPPHASLPHRTAVLHDLAEGRRRLWFSDAAGAAELLAQAAAAEPELPLPRLELARALDALGSVGRAKEEAHRAVELYAEGSDDALLGARALSALLDGRPRAAAKLQQRRIEAHPWRPSPRIALVHALLEAEDSRAAFAAIAELRSLPLGDAEQLRVELLAARAARTLGDTPGWLLLAESATERAAEIGLPLFEAQASLSTAEARLALQRPERAREAAEHARRLFLRFSHRRHAAMALAVVAVSRVAAGAPAEARALLRQAADELRQERDAGNRATVLYNLGLLELGSGDLDAAQALSSESLQLRRSLADSIGAAESLLQLAEIEARRARPAEASARIAEALALLEGDGLSPREGGLALELAARLAVAPDLETSQTALATRARVRDLAAEAEDRELEARARSDLAESLLARGELAAARAELEQALALFGALGDGAGTERSRLLLAGLASEEGRFGAAAALAGQVVESSIESADRDVEAIARSILAWSQHRLGRQGAAANHMSRAREAAGEAVDPTTRLSVDLAAARLEAASGGDAQPELERLLGEAQRLGLARIALEAELALTELALQRGESDVGRRRLQEIAEGAERSGWLLLAERAHRARTRADDPQDAAADRLLESTPTPGLPPPP